MNRNIANKQITTKNGDTKSHQAYAMEYSRLKEAKKLCEKSGNCFEYNKIGGNDRFVEVENLVQSERRKDKLSKKIVDPTNPNNTHQKEKNGTEVSIPMVTKKSDHSGGETKKILSNSQSLSEEILNIKYLIEYMNNNNKNKII
jgi:hypothetical protein